MKFEKDEILPDARGDEGEAMIKTDRFTEGHRPYDGPCIDDKDRPTEPIWLNPDGSISLRAILELANRLNEKLDEKR